MLAGGVLVGVQRVAPRVQRVEPQAVAADLLQPGRSVLLAGQQRRHVAVRVRRVSAGPDLDVGYLGRLPLQPAEHVVERPVEEGFEHHADPRFAVFWHVPFIPVVGVGCGAAPGVLSP